MTRPTRAQIEWALVAAGVIVLAACLDFRISSDGAQRFRDLRQLMRQHHLDEPLLAVRTGCAAPLYILGQQVLTPQFWVSLIQLRDASRGFLRCGRFSAGTPTPGWRGGSCC